MASLHPISTLPSPQIIAANRLENTCLAQRRVFVFTQDVNGAGDISCGFKMVEFLNRMGVAQEKINLLILTRDKEQVAKFNSRQWNVSIVSSLTSEQLRKHVDTFRSQFLIIAPCGEEWSQNAKMWPVPKMVISEYGLPPAMPGDFALGLGRNELGIFIDPELSENASQPAEQRLKHLSEVNPKLREAILGTPKTDSETFAAFAKSSYLFTGYTHAHTSRRAFVLAIAEKVFELANETRNLCFVLPRSSAIEFENLAIPEASGLKIMPLDPEEIPSVTVQDNSAMRRNERIVTVITVPQLPYAEYLRIFQAAERDFVGSGDQSAPSEAVSRSMRFVYECRAHKTKTRDALTKLISSESPELGALFARTGNGPLRHDVYELDPSAMARFYHACSTTHQVEWQRVLEKIQKEHSFGPRFLEQAAKVIQASEKNAKSDFALPFTGQLQTLPFDIEVILNLTQIVALGIDTSGRANRMPFPDSTFRCRKVADDSWAVTRQHV